LLALCKENMPVEEEQIGAYIENALAEEKTRRQRLEARPFADQRAKKYLLAAFVLTLVSFLTKYSIYYRMLACVCMLLAAAAFFINRGTGNSASS